MANVANTTDDKSTFLADLERATVNGPDWARAIRSENAARFAAAELPHRRMEEWRFTNIAPILRTRFETPIAPKAVSVTKKDIENHRYGDQNWCELVFVDGYYVPALSRQKPGVTATSFAEAVSTKGDLLQQHLSKHLNGKANAFSILNTAFLIDGAFIHVAADNSIEYPIHLLFVNTGRVDIAAHPRNLFVLDSGAKATVIETHVALDNACRYLTNAVTEINVGENARLDLCKLIQESNEAYHLATTSVRLDKGATLESIAVTQSGKIVRNEIKTLLDGEGAHCSLKGLYMTRDEQLVDNPIAIEHAKPNCTSWIGYKGVLDDKSHAVFSGKVYVHRVAQKTDSNQLNQNMVLSDKATVDTKPLLEIFADDVKCTHGATVGRPPDELVFYFRTRGMSEAMALGMLTYGFADEVVRQIEVEPVRERLEQFVFNTYSPIPG